MSLYPSVASAAPPITWRPDAINHVRDEALPPDPGKAGKATLLGIDVNDNGIRDDVERYIVLENRYNPEIIPLLLNYAALTQDEFRRHAQGVAQPEGHLERALLNLDCIDYVDPSQGGERVLAMIDVVTNTPERWITKLKIDKEIGVDASKRRRERGY